MNSSERDGAQTRTKTVLVVDDNNDYRKIIAYLLRENAIRVCEAVNGAEGLRLAIKELPDLMIVDFNMPEMNGYELVQEIRSVPETRKIPIIIFTGASNRRQLKEMRLDISDFLEKPMANRAVVEKVLEVLGVSRAAIRVPDLDAPSEPTPDATFSPDDDVLLEMLDTQAEGDLKEEQGLEALANDHPLINRVNQILVQAVSMRASDIHIEPQLDNIKVRVRLDGTLQQLCTLPRSLHSRLGARLKIMSGLVITERRLPQDGRFNAVIKGEKIEFRVSTMPSAYGEKIVMRILGFAKLAADLGSFGLTERDFKSLDLALRSPHGLILVTGPTGSGKTTTLYTMLNVLNRPEINILTAEDPVEYQLPGITQVQINSAIGLSFEKVLRGFLRQDPDVMLIGEIRDLETAEIAVKAAVTGHLVFSTLHTSSAPGAVTRLIQMGVAPFLIAASVRLIVAQRLVKTLCAHCKVRVTTLSADQARFLTEAEIDGLSKTCRAVGCAKCRGTGYTGRAAVLEVMPVSSGAMRQMIQTSQNAGKITEFAKMEGLTTLRQAALRLTAKGETSLTEAFKILFGD